MTKERVIGAVMVGVLALIYGISPIDVVPDVLLPVGLVDDGAVIAIAVGIITRLLSTPKQR